MKSTKLMLLLSILFLAQLGLEAQPSQKVKVKVTPFEFTYRTASQAYVEMIRDHITIKLTNIPGVQLVAADDREKIMDEQDMLKSEPFIKSEHVEQGKLEGADKLLVAKVYLTSVKPTSTGGYSVSFSIYIAAVDVEKGITEDNIMLSPNGKTDYEQNMRMIRGIRWASRIPGKRMNLLEKLLNAAEKANLALSYTTDSSDPNQAFLQALDRMDKDLNPFLNYYFGDQTGGYVPEKTKSAAVKGKSGGGSATDTNDPGVKLYWDESIPTNKILIDLSTADLKKGSKLKARKQIPMPNDSFREVEVADLVVEKIEGAWALAKIKTKKITKDDIYQKDDIVIRVVESGFKNPFKKG